LALGAQFVDLLGARLAAALAARAPAPFARGWLAFFIHDDVGLGVFRLVVLVTVLDQAILDRGDMILVAGVDLLDVRDLVVLGGEDFLFVVVFVGAQRGFFLRVRLLFCEQGSAVGC